MTYGPDLSPETGCKVELIHELHKRWEIEDKRRRSDRISHFGEILLVLGASFLGFAFTFTAAGVEKGLIDPYFYGGAVLFFLGIGLVFFVPLFVEFFRTIRTMIRDLLN